MGDAGSGIKICLVGNSRVGKSCIAERLIHDRFNEHTERTSIGRVFFHKELTVNRKKVHMNIWDTAGEEKYKSLAPMYYRQASATVLVYDITDKESFHSLQEFWVPSVQSATDPSIALAIVGNKSDLEDASRVVSTNEARGYANSLKAVFLEASAKTGHNVERIFTELILKMRASDGERPGRGADGMQSRNVNVVGGTTSEEHPSTCICWH